jgi:hypothetical protein
MGMIWFIFSEVMFFAAFFGALFYARMLSVPWLGGEGDGMQTHNLLWQGFDAGVADQRPGQLSAAPFETIPAFGIPLLNTMLLLASGVTITIAHHALRAGQRGALLFWLAATVLLGAVFLYYQVHEYIRSLRPPQPDPGLGHLRLHVLHAHRFPRHARDPGRDHAERDLVPLCEGSLQQGQPLRFRSRGLVLALRRRGLARVVRIRLRALIRTSGSRLRGPAATPAPCFSRDPEFSVRRHAA